MPYKEFPDPAGKPIPVSFGPPMTETLTTLPPADLEISRIGYPNIAERIVRVVRDLLAIAALALASAVMIWVLVMLSAISERVHVG